MFSDVLARAAGSSLGVLLVEGDPGIGKTALIRTALAGSAAVVVHASGDESETDLDHGIVDQLVRDAPLDPTTRSELVGAISGDPLRTGEVLVRLVDRVLVDAANPLVAVVDDVQWADAPSLRALTFAARRLHRDRALLVLAVRTGEDHRLPSSLTRLVSDAGIRLRLGPLGTTAVQALARADHGETISAASADRLVRHTRGNPLHLRALLDELSPSALATPGDLPAPRSYSTLVLARVAGSSPDVEALVTAVAVLGERVPLATAACVAGIADPLAALDEGIAAGLLAITGDRGRRTPGLEVGAAHPLVRAAVLVDLPVARRADLHRRAGELLGGVAALRHRLLGSPGPDGDLWRQAMAAAADETARGAHSSAAGLLELAADVAPTAADREHADLEAVDVLLLAGRLSDGEARRGAVADAAPSARRSYVKARLAYVAGPRQAALGHLEEAWAAATEATSGDDADLTGRVAAMLAMVHVDRAGGDDAATWSRRALHLAPEHAARLSAGHMLAGAHALTGTLEVGLAEFDERCAQLGDAGASSAVVADMFCGRGQLRLWAHHLDDAGRDLTISLDAAQQGGSFAARESARVYLGEVRYRQGRWDEALVHAGVAASIVDDGEEAWLAWLPHATMARPLAARGSDATVHIERARRSAAETASGVGAVLVELAAVEVALCRWDLHEAAKLGDAVVAAGAGLVDERFAPWRASYAEALAGVGRLDDAARVARELGRSPSTPLVCNDAALAAVAVASAEGDATAADAAAAAGLALDPDAVGPYPRARLELAVGRGLRRRGERRRALAVLGAAAERFRELGATPWMERTEQELVAAGRRPASRPARAGEQLTPRELAVAQLVGSGLTNREVAVELIVSAKTVEHHLSRVYAKLGVRSRTELAVRLRDQP